MKKQGSKIIDIYDIGKNDTLEIEVDINDILGKTDKYIINIISQELRFDKKLNYYSPMEFIHRPSDKKEEEEEEKKEEEEEKEKKEEEEKEKKEEEEEKEKKEEEEEKEKKEEKEKEEEEEEEKKNNDDFPVVYIVVISAAGLIIILAIIFLVIRYCKRKGQDSDLSRKTENLSNEKLMEDF